MTWLPMDRDDFHLELLQAMDRESRVHAVYRGFYETVKDPVLNGLFHELAAEEAAHQAVLEGYLEQDTGGPPLPPAGESPAAGAWVPDPAPVSPALSEGLLIAIGNELETIRIYTVLVRLCDDARQKKIFTGFASVERGHKFRLEGIFASMSFPDGPEGRDRRP